MAWQDNYLQAKFRDVEFFIHRATKDTGRRIARHKFPRRDGIEYEDLGGDDKIFSLEAYVVGDDYFDRRNDLEAALDEGTPGVLVHPYRGVLRVVVPRYSTVETTDEGRVARFSITFELSEVDKLTSAAPNTRSQVVAAKEEVITQAKEWFFDIYSLAQAPANAVRDVRETLDKGLTVIDNAKRVAGSVADFKRQIDNTRGRLIALSLNAQYLADEFSDIINWGSDFTDGLSLGVTGSNARDQLREQRQIVDSTADPLVTSPPAIATDPSYPAQQIQTLIKYLALAGQMEVIAGIPFGAVEDAEEVQDEFFADLDRVLADPLTPDELYAALRDAKRAIFDDMQARVVTLPRLIEYQVERPTNALEFVFSFYGDLDNEEDFIRRNELIHPGFVPARTLQVRVLK